MSSALDDDAVKAQGVAALQASLQELMTALEERETECAALKDENRRTRAECTRLRTSLNDAYAAEADKTLSGGMQTVGLEMQIAADARRVQFLCEFAERRAEVERSLLSRELGMLETRATAEQRELSAELGQAEARVAALEQPVRNSLLGWLDMPADAQPRQATNS